MRISIISLTVIFAFLMNGCLIDRIKQRRMLAEQMEKNRQSKLIKRSSKLGVRAKRTTLYKPSSNNVEVPPTLTQNRQPLLYTPSSIEDNNFKTKTKKYTKKSSINKTKKVQKKRKKVNKNRKKVKKVTHEPYSIEKNEADPELLGPQTTLKENPLEENNI